MRYEAGVAGAGWFVKDHQDSSFCRGPMEEVQARRFAAGLNQGHSRSGADELRAALQRIEDLNPGGPHIDTSAALKAVITTVGRARVIARTALAKQPSKEGMDV